MKNLIFRYSLPTAPYAVEDCEICEIDIVNSQISFYFPDGVLADHGQSTTETTNAAKLIMICDPDDVLCSVYSPHLWGKKRWYTAQFPDFKEIIEAVNLHQIKITITSFLFSRKKFYCEQNFGINSWKSTLVL